MSILWGINKRKGFNYESEKYNIMVTQLKKLKFIIDDLQKFLDYNDEIDEDLWLKLDDCKDFMIDEIQPLFE
tara:strand:+ start:2099 stop:2314 length:216 start_codon:yes stop_codon:yes gene_type:complete